MLESETITAKIQFEVDNSINAFFQKIKKKLEGMREQLKTERTTKKCREKKWKNFTNRPSYGYYPLKLLSNTKEATNQTYTEMSQSIRIREREIVTGIVKENISKQ